jgi:hypothetical protein
MKHATAIIVIILHAALSVSATAQHVSPPQRLSRTVAGVMVGGGNEENVNRVKLTLNATGGLADQWDQSAWVNGWGGNNSYAWLFDHGMWVTGKRNGLIGGMPYFWRTFAAPGPVINGRPALAARPQDSLRYRVYSVTRGDDAGTNPDIAAWPADLGAPVDAQGKPRILGDQTLWSVYNAVDTVKMLNWNYVRTPSPQIVLPLEIRETVFAHYGDRADTTVWASTVFFEWAIYNVGTEPIDSVYLTLWTDPDLIDPYYDIPAVDTSAQTGYCWYARDPAYGAAGYTLLYGPAVPSSRDSAVYFGKKRAGYKNLPLSSFWPIFDDSYPDGSNLSLPYSLKTAWNVVRGFMPLGAPMLDSSTRSPTKFPYAGDPITGKGALCPWLSTGGGAGFLMTTGPCTIAAGDSQWVMVALMPAARLNGIDAVSRLRMNAAYLRSLPYDSLFTRKQRGTLPAIPLPVFAIPETFAMRPCFPNPFNNGTTIHFDLPERSHVKIEILNVLGQSIAILADDVLERGVRSISWFPVQASGVYFVRVLAESLESPRRWSAMQKCVFIK